MDELTPQPIPELALPQKRRRNVAFIVVIVLFCAVGVLALVNRNKVRSNTNNTTPAPFTTDEVVIVNYNNDKYTTTGTAVVAVDTQSLTDLNTASSNGSAVLDSLLALNKIFMTPNGTRARIIESRASISHIRIISGDAQGKDGWVNNVFLYQ